jgi:hypothetical protein
MRVAPGKPPARAPPALASLLHRPFESCLDGCRGGVDVVAVEAEAGFEAQRVTGAEADRLDVGMLEQALGDVLGHVGWNRDLVAVLAAVAGARDQTGDVVQTAVAHVHELHGGDVGPEFGQHIHRARPLQRDQRAVEHRDVAGIAEMLLQMGDDRHPCRRR